MIFRNLIEREQQIHYWIQSERCLILSEILKQIKTPKHFFIQTIITLSSPIQPNQIINTTLAIIVLKPKDRSCNPADPIRKTDRYIKFEKAVIHQTFLRIQSLNQL